MATTPRQASAVDGRATRVQWLAVSLILALGFMLMLVSARGDLAIDEVMSLERVLYIHSWVEIFTFIPTDNTHPLNSIFMYALGDQRNLYLYRIPAVLFGLAFLVALVFTSRRLGKNAPVWVAVLAGLSYPIILYASEARGYMPALFFAVLAYELIQQVWEQVAFPKLVLFWSVLILGILAHFSFIMLCIALGLWSLARGLMARTPPAKMLAEAVRLFGVPLAFLVFIYVIYLRKMAILGGDIFPWWVAISDVALYLLGFSPEGGFRLIAIVMAACLSLFAVVNLAREKRGEWIFFVMILLVSPAAMLILWKPKYLFFRYFSMTFPFFYLLLAYLFDRWAVTLERFKWLPWLLVATITVGHLVKIEGLIQYGRGNYRQAIADMAAATSGPLIKVSSDHDFRNGFLLDYYSRFLPASKRMDYIPKETRHDDPPDWVILHCFDATFTPYPDVEVAQLGKYPLFGVYPYCGSSGWSWFVYRRPASMSLSGTNSMAQ